MRSKKTLFIAIGGILIALSIGIMFLGSMVPFATFAIPAIASLCVFYIVAEYTRGAGLLVYVGVSVLALLLVPAKEAALLFAFFFGHYPVFKSLFETKLPRLWAWVMKMALLNVCVVGMYLLAIKVFMMEALIAEFSEMTTPFILALLLVGNIAFVLFDIALTRLLTAYVTVWRNRITNKK